jgi:hypothetical protein
VLMNTSLKIRRMMTSGHPAWLQKRQDAQPSSSVRLSLTV